MCVCVKGSYRSDMMWKYSPHQTQEMLVPLLHLAFPDYLSHPTPARFGVLLSSEVKTEALYLKQMVVSIPKSVFSTET